MQTVEMPGDVPSSGWESLTAWASQAGLPVPPRGAVDLNEVARLGRCRWSSDDGLGAVALYGLAIPPLVRALRGGHAFAFAHHGHGMNSYALTTLTGQGSVAVTYQHAWAGALRSRDDDARAIADAYVRIEGLLGDLVHDGVPEWLLVVSDYVVKASVLHLPTREIARIEPAGGASLLKQTCDRLLALQEER